MTLAFVDCCTLGPDIDLHAVYEVGIVVRDDNGDSEDSWFLAAEGLAFADRSWPDLERFFDQHPQGIAKHGSKIASELSLVDLETFSHGLLMLTRDATLITSSFCEERLRKIIRSQGLAHAWGEVIDLASFAKGARFKIPEGHPSALGRAKVSRLVYDSIVGTVT